MRAFLFFVLYGLGASLPAWAQTSITSFSPTGTVKGVRQVQATFSAQMVPFGDLRLSDPFTIECPEEGKGRWIDGSRWSYDFVRDLPAGVACRFTLKADLKDVKGVPLEGERSFDFNTGGPSVVEMAPREGSNAIDENQVFILGLDAIANEDSIAEHAWCRADGVNEKIGLRLLQGEERERILEQRKEYVNRYLSIYFRARGVVWRARTGVRSKRLEQMPLAVVQCKRRLPADADIALVWGAGIAAGSGMVTVQNQELTFHTRKDFTARFDCDKLAVKGPCIPFLPVRVDFSAPLRMADALAIKLTGPDGKVFPVSVGKEEYVSSVTIKGPFPEQSKLTLSLPAALKDDAGRPLLNQSRFPLTVRMDAQPPLVKFPARFGIIEAHGDKLLPVTVRNVEAALAVRMAKADRAAAIKGETLRVDGGAGGDQDQQVIAWLKRLSDNREEWQPSEQYGDMMSASIFASLKDAKPESFAMPKPGGAQAFEVIGIPLRKPGFYVVELASPKLGVALSGNSSTAYVSAAALVTNMVAHFKRGAQSSLVWVTSLDKAKPVAKANVAVRDCHGKLLWQGLTNGMGVANIAQELPETECGWRARYFVSARSGDDMTFTLSDWDRGIESWRFHVPTEGAGADRVIATTVFDRTLLRAGETVHMKHFLRRHANEGIVLTSMRPSQLFITHEGSGQKYEVPLHWGANGSADNVWNIPSDVKQGWYSVMLSGRESGRFRVEQFRVPTMKAVLQGPKEPAVRATSVDLDMQLSYLSGGGAGGAPVKLRTEIEERQLQFDDYPDYVFSRGDIKTGTENSSPSFDEDEGQFEGEREEGVAHGAVRTRNLVLDKNGGLRVALDQLPAVETPRDLTAELTWQDANGETSSVATHIPLWPSAYVIGVKPDSWTVSKDAFKFTVVVLDTQGKPVAGAPVAADFLQREYYAHRRRLIGGFYAYENSSKIKEAGPACEGRTNQQGLLICEVKAPASGNLILRARTHDGADHSTSTFQETWVADRSDWWFSATDNDRIDLLPEKKRYEPGENATFQVRMPFREATALVTVEREGVIDTYLRHLSGKEPVISIPIKKQYAPNVYVSVLAVRGRVAGVQPTALVDLGKPAYKLGIAPVRVGWAANELKVQVSADKPVYHIRDKAAVKVRVTRADGTPAPAGAEVALAAVDVGLLELMPNASWDLLEAMMQQRGLQVQTATAQMQVVGKRHFGRKAVPSGGGGGKGGARELFDTLLFWNARVKLDANGEASVQVPINDSLTAFRIVAVANAEADLFGTGRTEVRSSQDLILLSGLPALVREGDRFRAGYTLRNTTDGGVTVELGGSAGGKALPVQKATLAAGQAQEVGWDFQVPTGVSELEWEVEARVVARTDAGADSVAIGSPASMDKLRVKQKVVAVVPVRTVQATLMQLKRPQSMTIRLPEGALPGRGGVQAQFSARLGSDLPGVREYMKAYPYTCFEQETSRAIALRDEAMWAALAARAPAFQDGDGLLKYFSLMPFGSDTLTAYVLSAVQEAGYPIPDNLKSSMESALRAFVQGKIVRDSALPTADLAVRKVAALEALSRSAPVQAGDLESFTIAPNLWPTSAVIDWYLILHRSPGLPQREARLTEAQQILHSRLNWQGTTAGFSTERKDDWWWLMSSADANANRLLLAMLDNPAWQEEMGRLARGALGRQRKGHWDTTVANVWGVLALEEFSRKFEATPVSGTSSASLGNSSKSMAFAPDVLQGSVMLPWPRGESELQLEHVGKGKPWVTVQSLAALPLKAPLSSGYRISKTITPVEQQKPGVWSRGDVYRVHLDLEAQSDMTWVVVDDPIPASATVLGNGLGRDSKILSSGEKRTGWVWPAFEERTFEAFRSYFEFVPKGKWSVEYTVRLNNAGQFNLPPTRVEAMYSPEMFGEAPNAVLSVK